MLLAAAQTTTGGAALRPLLQAQVLLLTSRVLPHTHLLLAAARLWLVLSRAQSIYWPVLHPPQVRYQDQGPVSNHSRGQMCPASRVLLHSWIALLLG
jgi:hypothetical protein